MTLLVTVMAAIAATVVWYCSKQARELKVGTLCYLYWGASLMWLVDAVFGYAEQKADYFTPAFKDMVNDCFLGISVIVFGMLIWLIQMMLKDPYGVIKKFHS